MEDRRSADPGARVDRNGVAILVFAGAAAVIYLILMLILAALLESVADSISRDRFWKLLIYWAIFIAPAVPALGGAALVTDRLARPYNRAFLYYLATGLMMIGTVVFALFLLVGGGVRGMVLAALALATGLVAWVALRRVLVGRSG